MFLRKSRGKKSIATKPLKAVTRDITMKTGLGRVRATRTYLNVTTPRKENFNTNLLENSQQFPWIHEIKLSLMTFHIKMFSIIKIKMLCMCSQKTGHLWEFFR